ncbi:hypothetical protein [Cohnella thermotolerans]|uniref:hypothetical protein n=1 Tax=Cohnella thermotolerans TaxID=329858 RepID=UPI0012EBBE17|nr:hypothetical protein [Cohnella thermotolerans]
MSQRVLSPCIPSFYLSRVAQMAPGAAIYYGHLVIFTATDVGLPIGECGTKRRNSKSM